MATRRAAPSWAAVAERARKAVAANRLDITMGTYSRVWPSRIALDGWPGSEAERAEGQRRLAARAAEHGCSVATARRRSGRISLDVVEAVVVPDERTLVEVSGLAGDIAECRRRRRAIEARFPWLEPAEVREATSMLTAAGVGADLFEECCSFALSLRDRDVKGLTPRQIDIEGFHAKWLDSGRNRSAVTLLSGKGDLGLAERPKHARFTYLDPDRESLAGRLHDSADSDDPLAGPAYQPDIVVICENRDCAHFFPDAVPGGVSVMGDGDGAAGLAAAFPWIRDARELWYWGDMDADGLEALAAVRRVCPGARSVLMDMASYERFRHLGTSKRADGRTIGPREPRDLSGLLAQAELELYENLCSPGWDGPRRIEQERIRFADALEQMGLREQAL